MERKQIQAEIKADGEAGTITGYGSVFGNVDNGGDIVQRGAFAASLAKQSPLMLLGHDPNAVLGVWDEAKEDDRGLFMRGRINLDTQLGRDAYSNIKFSAIKGLSIGYKVHKSDYEGRSRVIKEAGLFEVSVVSMPMNEQAQISAVKAMDDGDFTQIKRILERAARDAGLSAREAKGAAAAAADHLSTARDAGKGVSEVVSDLRELVKMKAG